MKRADASGFRANGFSLIELLIVIGIIGLLAGLLIPALGRAKESARGAACLGNLRQIGIALQLYADENNNHLPSMRDKLFTTNPPSADELPGMDLALSNQLGNKMVLRCPADRARIFEQTASSYSWNSLLNGQDAAHLRIFARDFDPHQIPLSYDKEAFHLARGKNKGVNYLYADGHIKNLLVVEGSVKP